MDKGILLLFLSKYKESKPEEDYNVEGSDGESYKGTQTDDAPVKYLLNQAVKNEEPIQKIICIVTTEAKADGSFVKFQDMVETYIKSEKQLKSEYQKLPPIEFYQVDYDTSVLDTPIRAWGLYSQISKCLLREEKAFVYIDYSGGFRDISFLMTVIIRYMEYYNISCKKIVYSNYHYNGNNNIIQTIDCVYEMFQLLNGVDQFVRTGNAELLGECYQQEDADTEQILTLLIKFSQSISLCDVSEMDKIIPEISKALKKYDTKEKNGFFVEMFADLTKIIRKKLYMQEDETWGYPQIIRWCIDNNMLQQALTFYIEKMPKYYYDTRLLNLPKGMQKNGYPCQTEANAFYVKLFDYIFFKDENIRALKNAIKKLDVDSSEFNLKQFQNLKTHLSGKKEQEAVDRIIKFLNTHYENGLGKEISGEKKPDIFEKNEVSGNGKKFLRQLGSNRYFLHYFLYNKQIGTYEKKVLALDKVKNFKEKIEQSNVSNSELYEMMKYYCAFKIIRNKINHASEASNTEDEEKAIKRLREDHNICMDIEFDNIKELLKKGIDLSVMHSSRQK